MACMPILCNQLRGEIYRYKTFFFTNNSRSTPQWSGIDSQLQQLQGTAELLLLRESPWNKRVISKSPTLSYLSLQMRCREILSHPNSLTDLTHPNQNNVSIWICALLLLYPWYITEAQKNEMGELYIFIVTISQHRKSYLQNICQWLTYF